MWFLPNMKVFFDALRKKLGIGLSSDTSPDASPPPSTGYKYLDRFGFYMHPDRPGYFCGRCKQPLKSQKNGWQCAACGQFHRSPDQAGGGR